MEKWKAEGGLEQLKAAKKAAKREAKGLPPVKSKKRNKPSTSGGSPTKEPTGGSGAGFKSKEFIEDSDSGKLETRLLEGHVHYWVTVISSSCSAAAAVVCFRPLGQQKRK